MGCLFSRRPDDSVNELKPLINSDDDTTKNRTPSLTTTSLPSRTSTTTTVVTPTTPTEPHLNNMENSLFLYKNTKELMTTADTKKDLLTEIETPVTELTDDIVKELSLRAKVDASRAKQAIIDNNMLVGDAFSQILTEKIQLIMDETNENVHRSRKVLCEHYNDEQRAIQYLKDIQSLVNLGVTRSKALQIYYSHKGNMKRAIKTLSDSSSTDENQSSSVYYADETTHSEVEKKSIMKQSLLSDNSGVF